MTAVDKYFAPFLPFGIIKKSDYNVEADFTRIIWMRGSCADLLWKGSA